MAQLQPKTTEEQAEVSGEDKKEITSVGVRRLRASCTYESSDLTYHKDHLMDTGRLVSHNNGADSYVPNNHVKVENDVESMECFFGTLTRSDAERLLLAPGLGSGYFLIRCSGSVPGCYALSVRHYKEQRGPCVEHRLIQIKENGDCYIFKKQTFSSVSELLEYYRDHVGLCQLLTNPCPRKERNAMDVERNFTAVDKNAWEIDRTTLTFVQKMSTDEFGEIWKGFYTGEKNVAIKILKSHSISSDNPLEEAQILMQCQHDKLVRLLAVCTEEEPFYIVTELMSNGSLLDYLREGNGRNLKIHSLIDMATQVAYGMSFLEAKKIIHCDLAARNVLVGENNIVKVANFSLAKVTTDGEYNPSTNKKFPIKWTAPEAAQYRKFTVKSDVWSYGILLHEIMTKGQVPYPGMSNREVLNQVKCGYRMPKQSSTPDHVYSIMLQCWNKTAAERPTFEFLFYFFDDYFISTEAQKKELDCDA